MRWCLVKRICTAIVRIRSVPHIELTNNRSTKEIRTMQHDEEVETKSMKFYARSRRLSLNEGICVKCGRLANNFKDEISKKEYALSGFCQECQDQIFNDPLLEEFDE